ncbi:hypothetical protein DXC31_12425 [Mediterraneibacter gnavus]|uniref:Uncharacterized protein n=1 Tax=Mediterraneibacter gnavus TaxID=33038 RepID=A0A3E4V0X6_MEDGN|nr:hypothetical protein DXC31_12425 [Mediterraneibacter gnavus]
MKKYTEQELEQIREEYMDKAAFTAPEEVTKAFNELHERSMRILTHVQRLNLTMVSYTLRC